MNLAKCFRVGVYAAAVLGLAVHARATDFINGYGWVSTEGDVSSSTGGSPATLALSTCHNGSSTCTTSNADVTFTTAGINFSTGSNTFAAWLASSTFALNSLTYHNGVTGTQSLDPSIWEFSGTANFTTGESFTFEHDDGVTMIVDGITVVSEPGPTGAVSTPGTYTGPGGAQSFEIVYTECCSPPAVLQTNLTNGGTVPEPVSMVLLGTVIGCVGLLRRRRNSVN